jgi:hypothetical protein
MYSHVDESFDHTRHAGWQYPGLNQGNLGDTLRAVPPRIPGSATLTREHLLACIARHNAHMHRYVRRNSRRKNRLTMICIVSSSLAALITAGPAAGGTSFIDVVKSLLGLTDANAAGRLICLAAMLVSLVAAIAANINKSSDLPDRVAAAEAGLAELKKVAVELQFDRMSVADGSDHYSAVIERTAFVNFDEDSADGALARGWGRPTVGEVWRATHQAATRRQSW